MGTGILGGPRRDSGQIGVPPFRPFPTRPTAIWIQAVADVIRETGEPEKVGGLFRGKVDRSARFHKLRKIEIDQRKRPNEDKAPCPRCGCADKFLSGFLGWFPDLQFCAVIGHCCASRDAHAEAEREWRRRQLLDRQEDLLLSGLPLLEVKSGLLNKLHGPADEALRIFRQFRRELSPIHKHLRDVKHRNGGQLQLSEILRTAENASDSDYEGPAGFRGRGKDWVDTRDIEFGTFFGQTAVERNFDPIKHIEDVQRRLESFDLRPGEEEVVEIVVSMDDRHRSAAVAILQMVDKGYENVSSKLADFWEFFSEPNINLLNAYGTHPENSLPFQATYASDRKRRLVVLKHRGFQCKLSFEEKFTSFMIDWPD